MYHADIKLSSLSAQFISENSEIPPDIIFKFKDASCGDAGVAAHKMILAMVSKVWRNMFYVHNTADRSAKEIILEDATKPAFQIVIDSIYNAKPLKESLLGCSLHEVFAVLYLVTKYEIYDLVLVVEAFLSSFPVSEDTVVGVATDAMEYLSTFEACAQNVLLVCAKFLKAQFTDVKSFIGFVAKNSDRYAAVLKLVVMMDDMIIPCSNCNNEPCLNGIEVNASQFRENLKVAYNPADTTWSNYKYCTGDILRIVNDGEVEVKRKFVREGDFGLVWLIAAGTTVTSRVPTGDSTCTLLLITQPPNIHSMTTPLVARGACGIHIRSGDL